MAESRTPSQRALGASAAPEAPRSASAAPEAPRSASASRASSQRSAAALEAAAHGAAAPPGPAPASRTPSQRSSQRELSGGALGAAEGAHNTLRSGGADGAVVELGGGFGGGDGDDADAARMRELEAEHAEEQARAARQAAFELLAQDYKAGRRMDLTLPSGVRLHTDVLGDLRSFPYTACTVRIHYEGRLIDGATGAPRDEVFDSSRNRGIPHDYQHGAGFAIAGLEEALGFLSKGTRARIRVPAESGYKDAGFPPTIPPKCALLYDVELIAFE